MKKNREPIREENSGNWTASLSRPLIAALSLSIRPGRLSILIYHRVRSQPDALFPEEVDALVFDQHLEVLKTCFNIIPLSDAIRAIRRGKLPPRAACITFDDGYADNAEVALPILQKHGLHATFFISTGFLNGGRMWNDTVIELVRRAPGNILDLGAVGLDVFEIRSSHQRQQAASALIGKLKYLPLEMRHAQTERICSRVPVDLPRDLMMNSEQVRKLHSAGMEIGGHTINHPILARITGAAAETEIADGKEALEHMAGGMVRLFAYPNGKPNHDYLSEHVSIVKRLGFEGAVSTAPGAARVGADLYQLPRFTPWDRRPMQFILRMAQNMFRTPDTV